MIGFNKVLVSLMLLLLLVLIGCGVSVYLVHRGLPEVSSLESCFVGTMNNVKVCHKGKSYVKLPEVSQVFLDALIVSEDASFWHHDGFDWFEFKESLKINFLSGEYKRGASTISQQLVKNSFLSPEKSLFRKLEEFLLTRELESAFSKEFILEKYLNIVEFGPDLFGLQEATRYYFSKPPAQLNILESAYLVHLLPSPKRYSATFEKGELTDFSKRMILLICKRLHFYKKVSDEDYEFAQSHIDRFPWYSLPKGPVYWETMGDLLGDDAEDQLEESIEPSELDSSMDQLDEIDAISPDSLEKRITF
jgi:monofunctional biosynthetic peptidoglycan transglycosylase